MRLKRSALPSHRLKSSPPPGRFPGLLLGENTMKYRFISDPGHGWLEVSKDELTRLGLTDKVSHYSYQHEDKAYLEEDCDLSLFMSAKTDLGEEVEFIEVYQENTPVRHYESWGA